MTFVKLEPCFAGQATASLEVARMLLHSCGSEQAPHSGRTLLLHLQGTHDLLKTWGNPPCVCLAGLFHSIYGTNAFRRRSLGADQRPSLRAAIGVEAEALAWIFCSIQRPRAILRALQGGVQQRVRRAHQERELIRPRGHHCHYETLRADVPAGASAACHR